MRSSASARGRKPAARSQRRSMRRWTIPVAVEFVKADAGLDIGNTMIGMHLKHVAVPLRLSVKTIGEAPVNAARTRPKLIGGSRAEYPD